MKLQEKRENLVNQREGLKEHYIKICGAIEFIESMIADEEKNDAKEKPKKKD